LLTLKGALGFVVIGALRPRRNPRGTLGEREHALDERVLAATSAKREELEEIPLRWRPHAARRRRSNGRRCTRVQACTPTLSHLRWKAGITARDAVMVGDTSSTTWNRRINARVACEALRCGGNDPAALARGKLSMPIRSNSRRTSIEDRSSDRLLNENRSPTLESKKRDENPRKIRYKRARERLPRSSRQIQSIARRRGKSRTRTTWQHRKEKSGRSSLAFVGPKDRKWPTAFQSFVDLNDHRPHRSQSRCADRWRRRVLPVRARAISRAIVALTGRNTTRGVRVHHSTGRQVFALDSTYVHGQRTRVNSHCS
jgi:hypothetical protein